MFCWLLGVVINIEEGSFRNLFLFDSRSCTSMLTALFCVGMIHSSQYFELMSLSDDDQTIQ